MRTARLCVGVVAAGLLALLGSARGYDQSLGDCKAVAELFLNTCDHGDYDKPALCVTKSSSRQKRPCMRSLLRPNMRCELHVCTARTQTDHARVCTKRWALAMPVCGPVCARPPALAPCLCEHWPIGARPVVVWRGTRFFDLLLALARCARRAPGPCRGCAASPSLARTRKPASRAASPTAPTAHGSEGFASLAVWSPGKPRSACRPITSRTTAWRCVPPSGCHGADAVCRHRVAERTPALCMGIHANV